MNSSASQIQDIMNNQELYFRWKDKAKSKAKIVRPSYNSQTHPSDSRSLTEGARDHQLSIHGDTPLSSFIISGLRSEAETIRNSMQDLRETAIEVKRDDDIGEYRRRQSQDLFEDGSESESESESGSESDDQLSDSEGDSSSNETEGLENVEKANDGERNNDNDSNAAINDNEKENPNDTKRMSRNTFVEFLLPQAAGRPENDKIVAIASRRGHRQSRRSLKAHALTDIETEPFMVITILVVWSLIIFYLLQTQFMGKLILEVARPLILLAMLPCLGIGALLYYQTFGNTSESLRRRDNFVEIRGIQDESDTKDSLTRRAYFHAPARSHRRACRASLRKQQEEFLRLKDLREDKKLQPLPENLSFMLLGR